MAKPPARTKFRPGGGSGGGGGATGNWDAPDRPRAVTPPKRKPQVVPTSPPAAKPRVAKAPRPGRGRTVTSGGYRFEADENNRAARVSGRLRLQADQPRSRQNQRDAGKPDRLASDHGGHFIAREFGGPEIALNHFAQDAGVNRGEYRSLELSWKANLKLGRKVTVDIRPSYVGRSRRPTSLKVSFAVNGKRIIRNIPNQPKGK